MDELIIDEKKYVSSKRAAKMTGYAKDYIGQLCREGRVPARLVGRSWYVLETAIQDHRFGIKDEKPKNSVPPEPTIQKTWESPRYEASLHEPIPTINRMADIEPTELAPTPEEENSPGQYLQDSWREWFEHIAKKEQEPRAEESEEKEEEIEEKTEEKEPIKEEKEVRVPIHTVYELPPEDLLPMRQVTSRVNEEQVYEENREEYGGTGIKRGAYRTIQIIGLLLALVFAVFGAIGTGYYDSYSSSIHSIELISGSRVYNK